MLLSTTNHLGGIRIPRRSPDILTGEAVVAEEVGAPQTELEELYDRDLAADLDG